MVTEKPEEKNYFKNCMAKNLITKLNDNQLTGRKYLQQTNNY